MMPMSTYTDEAVISERIRVSRPVNEDVVYIFKVRYTAITTYADDKVVRLEHRCYYGGIDGTWNEFQPYDTLDYTARGCISMDGRNWTMLRNGIREMEDSERAELQSAMQDIVRMFRLEGSQ